MKHLIIIFACLFIISSCGEEEIIIFDGNQVGLNLDKSSILLVSSGPTDPGIEVLLIAQPKSSPTNVSFTINDASTAIEGLHYTSGGSTAVIPANENVGTLPIQILTQNFASNEQVTFDITITGGDNVMPSDFSANGTISVTVVCESVLAGTYTATAVGTSTDGCCAGTEYNSTATVTLTEVSTGTYTISDWSGNLYFDWYGPNGGNYGITQAYIDGGGMSADITDSCNAITASFTEPFGESCVIEGTVDGATGVITYTFLNGYGDTGIVTLTPQ